MTRDPAASGREQRRILDAYAARRSRVASGAVDPLRYTSFTPGYLVSRHILERRAVELLTARGWTNLSDKLVLDVGSGDGVIGESEGLHLHDFMRYGAQPENLYGVELQPEQVLRGHQLLPTAQIVEGSADALPFPDEMFHIVSQSTVFSSILDADMRAAVAAEMLRVLRPDGFILWYDFRRNNPRNPDIRRIGRAELRELFPGTDQRLRPITLASPVARLVARASVTVAMLLERISLLRTHEMGTISKRS